MTAFFQMISIFFPILLIASLGYIYAKVKKADPQMLSEIIIYLTIPALFFSSFYKHRLLVGDLLPIMGVLLFVVVFSFLAVYLLRKAFKLPLGLYLTTIFMNSAFVGFPVTLLAYGERGLALAVPYDFFNGLLIFTAGIYIISQGKNAFELFRLPFFYAAVLGFALNYFGIGLPSAVIRSLDMLGGMTIPLALLMLGFRLAVIRINSLRLPLLSSFIRMFLGAGLAWLACLMFNVEPNLSKVLIIMSALPSAFMSIALAEKYNKEVDLVSSSVALSTLLSVVFLPFLIWMLK